VAFCTQRTLFPLGAPAYVSAPAASVGLVELFDADLSDGTITRVTRAFGGGEPEHPHKPVAAGVVPYREFDGSLSPSFSANGLTLAFSSTASNLVYGDGNTPSLESVGFDGSDAFVITRQTFGFEPPAQEISNVPSEPALTPPWRMYLAARSDGDGTVEIDATVPAAGALHALAAGPTVARSAHARGARGGRRRRSASRRQQKGIASRANRHHRAHALKQSVVVSGALAEGSSHVGAGGLARLMLKLTPAYSALASQRGGISATVTVTFASPGRPLLRASIPVTFVREGGKRK
jgi:hypothetical protein